MSQNDNSAEVIRELDRLRDLTKRGAANAMRRIGGIVQSLAIEYAPKGPTQQELERLRKAEWKLRGKKPSGAQKAAWKASRKANSHSRPAPGSLMQSISMTSDATNATIFVASNSAAGKYAFRIHEQKGTAWKNRGPGTIAKGSKADEKFITRAIVDTRPQQIAILRSEIDKALSQGKK